VYNKQKMKKKNTAAKKKKKKKTPTKTTRRVSSLPSKKPVAKKTTTAPRTAARTATPRASKTNNSQSFMIFLILAALAIMALFFIVQNFWGNGNRTMVMVVPETTVNADLADNTWVWNGTVLADQEVVTPQVDGAFTLQFTAEDEALSITTDCNNGRSSYVIDNGSLTINPIASTMMFCLDSQESVFTRQLADVQTYAINGDELMLTLEDGSVMSFTLVPAMAQ
jgi:heat shock protein HslJ